MNYSDSEGGAARAAVRLVETLREAAVECDLLCSLKTTDHTWSIGSQGFSSGLRARMRSYIGGVLAKTQQPDDKQLRSVNRLPSKLDKLINRLPHDVINLHWIGAEQISIEAVANVDKPIVWTLHDMWPFTGAEHYAPDTSDARWRIGYPPSSRPNGAKGLDLDRATWLRKKAAWQVPQQVICPTRWLADCVQGSALMQGWPTRVIPNPLNLQLFQPWPKQLARDMFGLPQNEPLLAFGAIGGTRDPRKGWDLLLAALEIVRETLPGAHAVVFGQNRPSEGPTLPIQTHWTGHLRDEISLALLYSAVDLIVVPSRQDNLPQTATEAQACGCPVVAFDTCGLPDAVEHGVTGLLAPSFDTGALATHITSLLSNSSLRERQSISARARAIKLWNSADIVSAYLTAYSDALASY